MNNIETDQEYKDRIFDDLLKDSETLDKIRTVIKRDTKQHLLDIGHDKKAVDNLKIKGLENIERREKFTDIKIILCLRERENNNEN